MAGIVKGTPKGAGLRWPAEWEPHRATWLGWPHQAEDWPGKLPAIVWVYTEIVKNLARSEQVGIFVQNEQVEAGAKDALTKAGVDLSRCEFIRFATDRTWMRDIAPSFVKASGAGGEVTMVDWDFNGWAKYDNYERDNQVPARIAEHRAMRRYLPTAIGRHGKPEATTVVLEGGSIDGDGEGTMLTTEECLLSDVQARNPGVDRAAYEGIFADYLGTEKVLWLGRGIAGDDTHGHVDDLARFVKPGTIVLAHETDSRDDNYAPLQENWEKLQTMTDAKGRRLDVIKLPMPSPVVFDGMRLPASYANFYIANETVLVPTFNDPRDREALGILAELFPQKRVVGIHAVDLVWGLGTLHCLSHEEPR
ncbi:MAG: agmatine deiminase family protein [Polyangiaceae bacterium]